jgi:ECF sigma factor
MQRHDTPLTELLQLAAQGERSALERVFTVLYPDLRRIAHARLRSQGGHARALAAAGRLPEAADALRQARDVLATAGLPADQSLLKQTQRDLRASRTARQ